MQMPAPGRPKASHRPIATAVRMIAWSGITLLSSAAALAQTVLPQGGSVASGQARISAPSPNALSITQNSVRAIINWNSFSVGPGGSVNFLQPDASSAILNRVTGSTSSNVAGAISGNGQVFLVNPNGIAITPSGAVQVGGGFVASTLDISDANFNAGNLTFAGNGASAAVSHAGSISSASGGFIGLIGGTVSNSGTIRVPLGKVGLGSGERVTLDPTGDGFLQVAVPTGTVTADGHALVDVAGRIRAAGGSIEISAATAQQAARNAVNVSGALSARSVGGRNGRIVLEGGDGGTVVVSGELAATGGRQAAGGAITLTGGNIALRGAVVDVTGGTGGGSIEIGGGPRGSGLLPHAATTRVDGASTLKADATVNGNGGNVTVWSDQATDFAGHISARGGPQGGNGGQAEVSGKAELDLTGDYSKTPLADLSALRGTSGTILFDPGTVNIINQTSLANQSALNGPDTFTAQFISGQLGSNCVTIDTNNATGANGTAGDINLLSNAHIAWSTGNTLTLNAARNINFAAGASITGNGGGAGLVLRSDSAGSGTGTVKFVGGTQVSLPSGSVDIAYNPASNPAGSPVNGTSYSGAAPASETWSSFVNAANLRSQMLINSIADLQNINNNLVGSYLLGRSISAAAASGGAGFVPLGTDGASTVLNGGHGFAGGFDGGGHTIDGLTISRSGVGYVALFGDIGATAVIQKTGLTDVVVTGGGGGNMFTGSLVGFAEAGSSITNSYSTGHVAGVNGVGGLVGQSLGTLTSSYSTAAVTGTSRVGGLAGETDGTIGQSYATGTVTVGAAASYVGGLVGFVNGGSVTQSYATGSVMAGNASGAIGGLIGQLNAIITQSYATGSVTANGQGIGGLVGYNQGGGSISQSYATGVVNGNSYVGGLVGWNDGSVTQSYASGAAVGNAGSYDVGGLVGLNNGSITTTWSSGASSGINNVGGLVGLNNNTIANSYYDSQTSGQGNNGVGSGAAAGATGLLTSLARTQAQYAGWDFGATWWMQDGQTRPFLQSEYSSTIVNAHQLQLINLSSATLSAPYKLGANIDASVTNGLAASGMWRSSGFVPLGTDGAGAFLNAGQGFTGSFNGAGHSIDQLTIAPTTDYGASYGNGLFGLLGAGALVSNIGLTNVSITATTNTGALAGINYGGVISNAFSTGLVTGNSSVGGLVGNNNQPTGMIRNSYSTVDVSGSAQYVGGLVGVQENSATIANSYASGQVSGADQIGGLVGNNASGSITNSYASGPVNGSSNVGGFVGANNGNISNSLSTAVVTGGAGPAGRFVGSNAGTITQSYFDSSIAGPANGVGSGAAGATGVATLQDGSLPAGFAAVNWTASGGSYPQLAWQVAPAAPGLIKFTAADTGWGSVVYGSAPPNFSYSVVVTDGNGNTLCSANCSAYFSGTPLIDTLYSFSTSAGASTPGYIAHGMVVPQSGYAVQYVNDTLAVVGRMLTITASNQSKTYGAVAGLGTSAFTTTGLVNGDAVSGATLTSTGSGAAANAGSYRIVPSAAVGTGLSNYLINYADTGQLTVNPAPVSVTALSGTSTYLSSPLDPGLSATGLQNGQTVNVLTGLRNSFGVTSTSSVGSYPLSVAGTLTNPNYRIVSVTPGSWTVTPLRGSVNGGSSPSNAGLAGVAPIAITGSGALNQLRVASNPINPGNPAGVKPIGGAVSPAKLIPVGPGPATTSPIQMPAAAPAPDTVLRGAVTAAPILNGRCSDGAACGAVAPNQPRRLIDFTLSMLNRGALSEALGREFDDVTGGVGGLRAVLWTAFGVSGLGLSAGFVGWLLRRGALLSALLASMPIWRGFDPMMVLMQRPDSRDEKKPDDRDQPPSDVDRMFDDAGSATAEGLRP